MWHEPARFSEGARTKANSGFFPGLAAAVLYLVILSLLPTLAQGASSLVAGNANVRAVKIYEETRNNLQQSPKDSDLAWKFARACFDRGEFATNNAERALIAQEGIAAAERAVGMQSNSAPAYYYLGMNLGQLARTKTLGALRLVDRMVVAFRHSGALDSHFDYAGSDRNLGLLHRDAPSIGSVGSRSKARQHLERAARLEPGYPENRLALGESYTRWGDNQSARRELAEIQRNWTAAQAQLQGQQWELSWEDWTKRLKDLEKKLETDRTLSSPHQA